MSESGHQLFVVKSNDGIAVRLSSVDRLLKDIESFEVTIYGLPPESLNKSLLAIGSLIDWSP
jgi:hypothetical protein